MTDKIPGVEAQNRLSELMSLVGELIEGMEPDDRGPAFLKAIERFGPDQIRLMLLGAAVTDYERTKTMADLLSECERLRSQLAAVEALLPGTDEEFPIFPFQVREALGAKLSDYLLIPRSAIAAAALADPVGPQNVETHGGHALPTELQATCRDCGGSGYARDWGGTECGTCKGSGLAVRLPTEPQEG